MLSRTLIVLLIVVGLPGCRAGPPTRPTESASNRSAASAEQTLAPTGHGIAMIHGAHCGGAMLTLEQEQRLSRPAAQLSFVVLAGNHNTAAEPVARFTTNEAGGFQLPKLSAGTYCVVRAANQISAEREAELLALPPPPPPPEARPNETVIDQECLKRLPLQCDAIWETGKPNFQPRVDLAGSRCPWNQPCTQYNGPLPP